MIQGTERHSVEHRPRRRVLVVSPSVVATFIEQDRDLLESAFDAHLFRFDGWRSLPALRKEVRESDAVVIWFVGAQAVPATWFARRAGVPVLTIVGGYEIAWIPAVRYGRKPGSSADRVTRWVLNRSHRVIAVSPFNERQIHTRVPEVIGKTTRVDNAINTDRFRYEKMQSRDGVLCVGNINADTIDTKGWRLFWDVAAAMPDVRFTAIGHAADRIGERHVAVCPENLTWLGPLYGDDLIRRFQNASVYFQGSLHESFCLALGEAMACGCIPVVSPHANLPHLAGDTGFVMESPRISNAVRAVRQALGADDAQRQRARQRIVDHFGVERRRRRLCRIISEVIAGERSQ